PGNRDMSTGTVQLACAPNPTATQHFELAGVDQSLADANSDGILDGFVDNFALQRLEIGAGCVARFVDAFVNISTKPCSEALYVHELVVGEAAHVMVDCGKVYYESAAGSGSAYEVAFSNGGLIIYAGLQGDVNADGVADTGDIAPFVGLLMNG